MKEIYFPPTFFTLLFASADVITGSDAASGGDGGGNNDNDNKPAPGSSDPAAPDLDWN